MSVCILPSHQNLMPSSSGPLLVAIKPASKGNSFMNTILSLYFIQTFPQGIFRNFTTYIFMHNFRTAKQVVSAMLAPACL